MEKDIASAEAHIEEARSGVKKLQKELGKLQAELKSSEVRTARPRHVNLTLTIHSIGRSRQSGTQTPGGARNAQPLRRGA